MPETTNLKYPVVVPGAGPVPALGMIIGEAPGRTEIEKGIPFCGRSGALLDEILQHVGSSRSEVYITNIFKGDVGSGNRNPTEDELADHWELLGVEVSKVNPKAILLLGRIAGAAFFTPFGRMGDRVGRWGLVGDRPTMVGYHPAYVLRGGYPRNYWERDIRRFVEFIRD